MLLKSLAYARLSFFMAEKNSTTFCLLENVPSVEAYLKSVFQCSSNRLKKYFSKAFLSKSLKARAELVLPFDFINDGEINPDYEGPLVDILAEAGPFLVLKKPAGVFVHPLSYSEKNNCLSFLRQKRPELLDVNRDHYDRGLLYRLDYETSGVLIYVKDEEAYRFLREHFKTVARKKIYHCLVEGECKLSGEFTHYFSSGEEKGRRVLVSDHGDQPGTLRLRPIRTLKEQQVTLMEVELFQGLRHQIRAQLAYLGYPLRGDSFYGGRPARRLYLNASKYEIHYRDHNFSFSCEPTDFEGL